MTVDTSEEGTANASSRSGLEVDCWAWIDALHFGPTAARVDALENRPLQSVVSGMAYQLVGLTLVSFLALLLIATGIGILANPFQFVAPLFYWILSFIAICGLIGGRFEFSKSVVFTTFLGGACFTLLYAVP